MAPRSAARVLEAPPERPNEPVCEQAQELRVQNELLAELLGELREWRTAFKPAADAVAELGSAQRKFCKFLVNNRLKLVGGTITALIAIGAISPTVGEKLNAVLAGFGL
jgi:hypothetical protein